MRDRETFGQHVLEDLIAPDEFDARVSSAARHVGEEAQRYSYSKVHRDSDKRLRNKSKSGHEERVLATQKCLPAGGNGRAFDARCLLDF